MPDRSDLLASAYTAAAIECIAVMILIIGGAILLTGGPL